MQRDMLHYNKHHVKAKGQHGERKVLGYSHTAGCRLLRQSPHRYGFRLPTLQQKWLKSTDDNANEAVSKQQTNCDTPQEEQQGRWGQGMESPPGVGTWKWVQNMAQQHLAKYLPNKILFLSQVFGYKAMFFSEYRLLEEEPPYVLSGPYPCYLAS